MSPVSKLGVHVPFLSGSVGGTRFRMGYFFSLSHALSIFMSIKDPTLISGP